MLDNIKTDPAGLFCSLCSFLSPSNRSNINSSKSGNSPSPLFGRKASPTSSPVSLLLTRKALYLPSSDRDSLMLGGWEAGEHI